VASQQYKDRLMRVVNELGDDAVVKVVEFAESLGGVSPEENGKPYRNLGFCRGQIRIDPSFYDPLPEEILRQFEGDEE